MTNLDKEPSDIMTIIVVTVMIGIGLGLVYGVITYITSM